MIEALNGLLKTLRDWRHDGSQAYELICCAAAVLTLISFATQQPPSRVLAAGVHLLGADTVATWLTSHIPLLNAGPFPEASAAVVLVIAVLLLMMITKPFFDAALDNVSVDLQIRGLVYSRAAGTFWILLMIAAQLAPLNWDTLTLIPRTPLLSTFATMIVVAGGTFLWVAHVKKSPTVGEGCPRIVTSGKALLMTFAALLAALVAPFIDVTHWASTTESAILRETKRDLAAYRYRKPSGAVPLERVPE
ncbi:hypothetical protein EII34_10295 [Arachnia propionica]|uniref:Uncharacterized protein n=1 Tax=Arachnia propionica TaxID=1750 RepID=A0A3P1T4K6_9ACTN|nr:hypothetical protein [Arachnia propionica]RRD04442.1 hypothetical protein EII34_10295 [Arachnia propionica]